MLILTIEVYNILIDILSYASKDLRLVLSDLLYRDCKILSILAKYDALQLKLKFNLRLGRTEPTLEIYDCLIFEKEKVLSQDKVVIETTFFFKNHLYRTDVKCGDLRQFHHPLLVLG